MLNYSTLSVKIQYFSEQDSYNFIAFNFG